MVHVMPCIHVAWLWCRLDPVTAGPGDVEDGPSPLDHMTDEEKEIEAEKLAELFDKLNRYLTQYNHHCMCC